MKHISPKQSSIFFRLVRENVETPAARLKSCPDTGHVLEALIHGYCLSSIADKFALLSKFPNIGKSLGSEQRPDVRTFPVGNYVIFYSVKPGEIRILRVIHARRDAQSVFAEE